LKNCLQRRKEGRGILKIKVQKAKLQSKNQKLKPIDLSRLKIRELEHGFSYDLKKQSQSQNDKIGVILALTMSYGDFSR
jgi:hypothetical protein